MATKPVWSICMVKYNVRDYLAALVKPPSTLVAKSHRLLSILREATVTMKLYPLGLDWSFQSHQLRWEGLHLSTFYAGHEVLPHHCLIISAASSTMKFHIILYIHVRSMHYNNMKGGKLIYL